MTCNLGKVKSNAIVTRGGEQYNEQEVNAYINLFIYAQQFYGRKDHDEYSFSMFYSNAPYHDLIFQDSTRQLQIIERSKRRWDLYVGADFLRARRITDCDSKGIKFNLSVSLVLGIIALKIVQSIL
jgi:melanoma-associated antigen p97